MMSWVLAIPVFLIVYNGLEILFESRRSKTDAWSTQPQARSESGLRSLTGSLGRMGFNKLILQRKGYREKLETKLMRSGHVFGWKPEDLLLYKEIGVLLAVFLLWENNCHVPLLWAFGIIAGFWLPEFYVQAKGSARMREIRRQLPGFVDLLALALESGLDLLAAIERITSKMKPSVLRDELQMIIQENRLGTPRKEALQHFASRTDLQDVHSLTGMVIQSEELGTSLASVLRNYAEDMRSRRISQAEEIAGKAPVKLLFPMMVFFFPIVFIIIFGPLALNLMSTYK